MGNTERKVSRGQMISVGESMIFYPFHTAGRPIGAASGRASAFAGKTSCSYGSTRANNWSVGGISNTSATGAQARERSHQPNGI